MSLAPLKLDLDSGKCYTGLGDLVMLSWLIAGRRDVERPIHIHRTRNLDLAKLLDLPIDPEPGGLRLDPAYEQELADRGSRPRLDYIRDFLEVTTPLVRPTIRIAPEVEAWADQRLRELDQPLVILFPQTAWKTREWPASYWVDVAWKLKAAGVPVLLLMAPKDERFTNTPLHWWGLSIEQTAALIRRAALVVGSDSFPAHLAGAIGVSTLALLGPTRPTVFAHSPTVECLASTAIECTGCHFGTPFRAACDQGCHSLFRLFPDEVIRHITIHLNHPCQHK